jgi:uncharacterized protein YlxP (DUF503 family)
MAEQLDVRPRRRREGEDDRADDGSECAHVRLDDEIAPRFNSGMGAGYVGILSAELHFPEAGSLKGKRKYVKSAKAQLQQRFGAAVAEVDHHELWQRTRLTLSCVAREHHELLALLDGAERYLAGQEWELGLVEREVVSLDD